MYFQKRQNKYGNIKQNYQGYIYASKRESQRAYELDMLLKGKEILKWERQINLPLYFRERKICDYRIDFIRHEKNKDIVLEEIKGMELPAWRLKRNLLEAILEYPLSKEYELIAKKIGAKKTQEIKYEVLK